MRYLVIICMLFCSCMSQKKWAEGCAARFPVSEKVVYKPGAVVYDTSYIAGDTVVFTDTLQVDCDTVKGVVTKYINTTKPCPPVLTITVTKVDTIAVTVVDRAAVAASLVRATEQQQRADRLQDGRNTWRWIAIICFALIAGAVVGKIKGLL